MDHALARSAERLLSASGPGAGNITRWKRFGGNTHGDNFLIYTAVGKSFVVKTGRSRARLPFECEVSGLKELGSYANPHCQIVRAAGLGLDPFPFIILEYIQSSTLGKKFFARLGAGLARLHLDSSRDRVRDKGGYGFHRDNFIGDQIQKNSSSCDWVSFFRDRRLSFQLKIAHENGYRGELSSRGDTLLNRLDQWIAEPQEPPCLLHGDLWRGNVLAGKDQTPFLIDPAVYFGRREADLAMTMLFGAFPPVFYSSYQEIWPLEAGSSQRFLVYQLYHYLNHLNLFGSSYLDSCLDVLRRLT